MKTRGSWVRVVKFVGVTGLVCGLLVVAAFRSAGKRSPQIGAGLSAVAASQAPKTSAATDDPKWGEAYGKLPLSFEENQGQTAREVRYVSHGNGYELFLTPQEAVLALRPSTNYDLSPLHRAAYIQAIREARQTGQMTVIRMHLDGANPEPQMIGTDRLPTKVNYFIGNDPKNWHTDLPSYARVKYAGVYPGVDLVFYGNQRRLEYDFVVSPGADPKAIALRVDGARKMRINSDGDLVLGVSGGEVELQKPVVYQIIKGERREIAGRYTMAGNHRVSFAVGSYDRSEPLVLDPVLNYSTYLGGTGIGNDIGYAIAVDSSGDAFVAGQTVTVDFPTTSGAVVTSKNPNSGAAYVAELNPAGTQLLYSTYLCGAITNPAESAFGVAVDSTGKIYVTGMTFAIDFPTTPTSLKPGPLSTNPNGTGFLTKLDPTKSGTASLVYSTYLGGTGGDSGNAIAVDAAGVNAYVAGNTTSANFPTKNPFQSAPATGNTTGSAFLTRIDTTQSGPNSLIYSTYLGGNGVHTGGLFPGDLALGVAVDSSNVAYVSGTTASTNFPTTTTAFQTAPPVGNIHSAVFVSKIDTTKTGSPSLVYSTYLAGSTLDTGIAVALGPNNVVYVTGQTNSTDFPVSPLPGAGGPAVSGAFDTTGASGRAFISLVDTTKTMAASLQYSTYLGGGGGTTGFGIKTDASGNAYVGGTTGSSDFPGTKTLGAFQGSLSNTIGNAFIAKLNPGANGQKDLLYSTYFGGSSDGTHSDQGFAIALDSSTPPNAYITGQTYSANLPVFPKAPASPTAYQPALHGSSDAYVAKLTLIPTFTVMPTTLSFGTVFIPNTSPAQTVTLTNNTSAAIPFTSAVVNGSPAAANTDYTVTNSCSGSIPFGATNTCTVSVKFKPTVAGSETATLQLTDSVSTSSQSVGLSGTGAIPTPAVMLAPTSLTFGNQTLNTTSAAQTVTLTNTGTGPLTIISIAASGDFAQTSTGASACPITPPATPLAAGASCMISVTFTPTMAGTRMGTLTIMDNATGSPHTVSLTGTTTPPDFGLTGPTTVQNVTAGSTLPFSVTMTPVGGFTGTVALACTGAPSRSTCTVTPASVAAADGKTAQTAQVSLATTALMVPPTRIPTPPVSIRQVVPVLLAMLLMFLLARTQQMRMRLGMVAAMVLLLALAGCGGGYNGTPKGPATLTITGTSGTLTPKTAQVPISVN